MTGTRAATVTALGRLTWQQARIELGGASCAWSDLGGFHADQPAPETPPIATHLWGWDGTTAWRFRLDEPHLYGARLELGQGADQVVLTPIQARDPQGQTYPVDLQRLAGQLQLAVTIAEHPLTFLIKGA